MITSRNIPLEPTPLPASGGPGLLYQKKFTIPEAAEVLGIGETNLRAMIRDGKMPVLRITAKKMLLLESDLEEFITGRHVTLSKDERKQAKGKLSPLPKHVEQSEFMKKLRNGR